MVPAWFSLDKKSCDYLLMWELGCLCLRLKLPSVSFQTCLMVGEAAKTHPSSSSHQHSCRKGGQYQSKLNYCFWTLLFYWISQTIWGDEVVKMQKTESFFSQVKVWWSRWYSPTKQHMGEGTAGAWVRDRDSSETCQALKPGGPAHVCTEAVSPKREGPGRYPITHGREGSLLIATF